VDDTAYIFNDKGNGPDFFHHSDDGLDNQRKSGYPSASGRNRNGLAFRQFVESLAFPQAAYGFRLRVFHERAVKRLRHGDDTRQGHILEQGGNSQGFRGL